MHAKLAAEACEEKVDFLVGASGLLLLKKMVVVRVSDLKRAGRSCAAEYLNWCKCRS